MDIDPVVRSGCRGHRSPIRHDELTVPGLGPIGFKAMREPVRAASMRSVPQIFHCEEKAPSRVLGVRTVIRALGGHTSYVLQVESGRGRIDSKPCSPPKKGHIHS